MQKNLAKTPLLNTWRGDNIAIDASVIIGYGGLIINDSHINILDMLINYVQKVAQESCGQCIPCRNGFKDIIVQLQELGKHIENNLHSNTKPLSHPKNTNINQELNKRLENIKKISKLIMQSARCDIGQTSPKALIDIIAQAPELLIQSQTSTYKTTYTAIVTAPCINACPAHLNIPAYIENIKLGQFNKSYSYVLDKCAMPGTIGRVCERPCEKACKRGQNASPLAIRHLKRFLFDRSYELNYTESKPVHKNPNKIAIIGAGPAGLACAYYLAKQGLHVDIFEKQGKAGGMAKYGIPDYRLPSYVLETEISRVEAQGVKIHYNIDIGKDISLLELKKQGYKAIFIASGAPKAPNMRCQGEDEVSQGLISGIEYLHASNNGQKVVSGKKILVIGGGNVAMDCVRTALRQGFEDVQIIYRRTEQEMPADKEEIHEAKAEGVMFNFLLSPEEIIHEQGKVKALLCQKMTLGEADSSGRQKPIPIEGEKITIPCDVIMHAIGQKVDVNYILYNKTNKPVQGEASALDKYNNLNANSITGKVETFDNIFGGGDCVTGPSSLIAALAAGKRAAKHITQKLNKGIVAESSKEKLEHALHKINLIHTSEDAPKLDLSKTMPIHMLPINKRLQGFEEVEKSSSEFEACTEAKRCLQCLRIVMIAQ